MFLAQNGILTREILEQEYPNLLNVKQLWLNDNKLRKIDENTFKDLNLLEELYLFNNLIEEIEPGVFDGLSSLKQLRLYKNKLRKIEGDTFKELNLVEKLYLSLNQIEEIVPRLFVNLTNLKKLEFHNNKLSKIEADTFKGLIQLEILYLQKNQIEDIMPGAFDDLRNARVINLYANKLTHLSRATLRSLSSSVGFIDLRENNFSQTSIHSFYNKTILDKWNSGAYICIGDVYEPVSKIADILINSGGFKSDFNEFLSQFPESKHSSESSISSSLTKNHSMRESHDQSTLVDIHDPYVGKTFKDRYLVTKALGEGAFGNVYLVTDLSDNKWKAIKLIDLDELADNELHVLTRLNHENVVKYYDHFEFSFNRSAGNRKLKLSIITEFCENINKKGDLADQISERKRIKEKFKEQEIFKWIFEATCGLKYLHSQRVIHRDIKPENILLTKDSVVKIGDLGLSKITESSIHANTFTGTRVYMSPELLRNEKYTDKTDVWSLGCVLFEIMNLKKAFTKQQIEDVSKMTLPHHDHILFSRILEKMLKMKESDRIDSKTLYDELKKAADFLNSF